jgi:hypothetical protein
MFHPPRVGRENIHGNGTRKYALSSTRRRAKSGQAAAALGVSKSSLWRTMKRERIHNTQQSLTRHGRPALFDARTKRQLIREICKSPEKPWTYFACHFNCSVTTARKAADESGFHKRHKRIKPFLSPKAITRGKAWAITLIEKAGSDFYAWMRCLWS